MRPSKILPPSPSGTSSPAEPNSLPPPWNHTITGSGSAGAGSGVQTFRYRQSSFSLGVPSVDGRCGHELPKAVAARVSVHGAGGAGGRHRRSATGGAANGMPRKRRVPPTTSPWTMPSCRRSSVPCWICCPDVPAWSEQPSAPATHAATSSPAGVRAIRAGRSAESRDAACARMLGAYRVFMCRPAWRRSRSARLRRARSLARRARMEAVIFCGIQASGKTTFYRERFFDTHVRISLDLVRTRRREDLLIAACLAGRQPFVVDNTNATVADRARYIEPARSAGFAVVGYYFANDRRAAFDRNR